MNRNEFLVKTIRYCLIILLSGIAIAAGKKAVAGSGCASCTVKGTCPGKSGCSLFNKDR